VAVFSVIAFVVGIAAALKLSAVTASYLKDSVNVAAKWLPVLSFALVFLMVVLLVRWGAKLIEKTFKTVMLGWVNKLAGMALYAVLYLIILSIFIFYVQKINLISQETIRGSQLYPFIQPWGPKVIDGIGMVIPWFKDMFTELETFFSKIANSIQK
jgi:membrane protein required for colicin V production